MPTTQDTIAHHLQEARALEQALVRTLQAHAAMAPDGPYRTLLEQHVQQTRAHADRIGRRLADLRRAESPLEAGYGLAQRLVGQLLALGKAPLDLVRGTSRERKLLANAKEECASEALEIATYDALEALARAGGDERTAQLAADHRADEERMLTRLRELLPELAADAVGAPPPAAPTRRAPPARPAAAAVRPPPPAAARPRPAARRSARPRPARAAARPATSAAATPRTRPAKVAPAAEAARPRSRLARAAPAAEGARPRSAEAAHVAARPRPASATPGPARAAPAAEAATLRPAAAPRPGSGTAAADSGSATTRPASTPDDAAARRAVAAPADAERAAPDPAGAR